MATGAGELKSKQVAAAVAAVQAYLETERRFERSFADDVSAWRRAMMRGRRRSWTGRDAAVSAR